MFELRVDPEEKQLLPFYGMPVCLLMKDGSSKVGRLTACRAGKIILNGSDVGDTDATVSRNKQSRRNSRPRSRKTKETTAAVSPVIQGGEDDFALGPFDPGPTGFTASPPERISLRSVDSVLIL